MIDEVLQDTNTGNENVNISDDEDIMKDFNFDDITEKNDSVEDILYNNSENEDQIGAFDIDNQNTALTENDNFHEAFSGEQSDNYGIDEAGEQNITSENSDSFSEDTKNSFDLSSPDNNYNFDESTQNYNYEGAVDVPADNTIKNMNDGTSIRENSNIASLRLYDGSKTDKMYQIDKNFTSDGFTGNQEMDTIHVNVGYDTYGWNVEFANGVSMSIRDVKEYQIRNNALPFNSGNISYGQEVLSFKNVKRIVVYESVKYFAYGA